MRGKAKRIKSVFGILIPIMLFVITGWASHGEAAKSPKEFYKGKIIRIVVSAMPGGGTDLSARIIAPYLAKYTGASNVAIQNNAAAGGLVAKNYVFSSAKPNGLTLGIDPGSIPFQNYLMDIPGVRFDVLGAPYIANYADQRWFGLVSAKGPYNSIEDLKSAKGLKFGGATAGGGVTLSSVLVLYLFDLDGKVITGFRGTTGVALSLRKNELDGGSGQTSSVLNNMRQGYVKPLVVLDYKRIKQLPDVPAVTELIKLTPEKKEMLDSHQFVPNTKIMTAPPGTPKDRVQFLRDAMEKVKNDLEFKKKIEKAMGIDCDWISIEETEKMARQATEQKKKGSFKKLENLMKRYRFTR